LGFITRVARWYIFIPKIPILAYIFWRALYVIQNVGMLYGYWYMLRSFGKLYCHLFYFAVIWYIYFPVLVCIPKNLATLDSSLQTVSILFCLGCTDRRNVFFWRVLCHSSWTNQVSKLAERRAMVKLTAVDNKASGQTREIGISSIRGKSLEPILRLLNLKPQRQRCSRL
jgi:hypothetical protein